MPKPLILSGDYLLTVTNLDYSFTRKTKYPQVIIKAKVDAKYVTDATELEQHGLDAPGFVDWTANDEEALLYCILFNSDTRYVVEGQDATALPGYTSIKEAFGWDGISLAKLNDDTFVGSQFQAHFEDEEYNGKVSPKWKWLRHKDATPGSRGRKLTDEEIKAEQGKIVGIAPTAKVKPIKPSKTAAKAGTKEAPPTSPGNDDIPF